MSPREQVALTINVSLHRLPLILEILEEIDETNPGFPGDVELRNGSIRAVHAIAERLGRNEPAPVADSVPPSEAEQIANEWLLGERPGRLLPEHLLELLASSITRLLPLTSTPARRKGSSS